MGTGSEAWGLPVPPKPFHRAFRHARVRNAIRGPAPAIGYQPARDRIQCYPGLFWGPLLIQKQGRTRHTLERPQARGTEIHEPGISLVVFSPPRPGILIVVSQEF